VSGSRRDRLDTWLFLPPELEREGPALFALLDDPDAPERTLAERQREVEELVLAGTPERWQSYLRARGEQVRAVLAGDPAPAVRAQAVKALAASDPSRFLETLSGLEPDRQWSVRAAVAESLRSLPVDTARAENPYGARCRVPSAAASTAPRRASRSGISFPGGFRIRS
jgi:hypothetical protein